MIKTPNGRIAFDQNRKITETTETITINDNVTIYLPQSLRELVDIIPFCLAPEDVRTLPGWKLPPEKPERTGACLCVHDTRIGFGAEWMVCAFDLDKDIFYDFNGHDVTSSVQKFLPLPNLEPPFYKEEQK